MIISILTSSFSRVWYSTKEISRKEDTVLLLYYHVDHEIIVLKDYEDVRKRFNYYSVLPCSGPLFIDSMLVIEGQFYITDSSKVLFYDQCEYLDITIPFTNELLTIDHVVNDSIVGILFNKQNYILEPGGEFVDSIVSIYKEGERLVRNTAILHLENYGLFNKSSIINYSELWIKEKRYSDSIIMEILHKPIEDK